MKKFLGALWKMIRSNLVLKIAALLFAVVLWSYVLSQTNPMREREIPDVKVTWKNIESLEEQGLAVSGDLADILDTVDIRVRVNQNDLKYLSNAKAEATVDLSKINGKGVYTLPVSATTEYGQVLQKNPKEITLYIDDRISKDVPVNVETAGSVADGYYADPPEISPDVVKITGASVDIAKVASALCEIDLSGLEQGYRKSVDLTLLDNEGAPVDPGLFSEPQMSVTVNLSVLPVKTVRVDYQGSIIGQDSLATGYEITGISCNPETVRIVGEASALRGVSSIGLTPLSVGGFSADTVMLCEYAPPEGVRVLNPGKAEVIVYIREITEQKDYSGVEIALKNLPSGLQATAEPDTVDVTVTAGVPRMSRLSRGDIVPFVDLDGLEAGTYTLSVMFEIPEGFTAENFMTATASVNVTITKK